LVCDRSAELGRFGGSGVLLMGVGDWLKRLLRGRKERSRLPEVLGYVTDEQGQRLALQRGWVKHQSLSEEQVRRVARLREVLAEAYPMTITSASNILTNHLAAAY
jgi:hypothetical protein